MKFHDILPEICAILYNVDRCIPVLPKSRSREILSIQANGNCINIYSQENCVGQFIRLQTNFGFLYAKYIAAGFDQDFILVTSENMTVASIGPCFEKCDPQNWVGMRKDLSAEVTLYQEKNFTGTHSTFSISEMQCVRTPRPSMKSWNSIRISGTATTTCVQLHDDATCGFNSVQLRPGYPHLHDLWHWRFYRGASFAVLARSVSLCGNSCPAVVDKLSTTPKTTTTTRHATTITTLEEQVTNQSNMHILQKGNNSQEEQPPHSPVGAILLIILATLFVLGFSGFVGVYFFRRYRNVHPPSQPERSKVIYKSQAEIR
ncbi:hypothetical protein Fcan01_19983 [Folsomia candida]|uniref:Uncharacterized protein n=1 Tax=Folsomia candida TaxID=158441 RepID=A0A226DHN0_FOLCA|nr:hypothetical protein Fcan01_19983 [Folsomia candida]